MQMISAFQAFTPAFIISGGGGGPVDSVLFYTLYLYQQGFSNFRMGYASAMAWILLVIIGVLTAIAFLISRYWVYYEDEHDERCPDKPPPLPQFCADDLFAGNTLITHALLLGASVSCSIRCCG